MNRADRSSPFRSCALLVVCGLALALPAQAGDSPESVRAAIETANQALADGIREGAPAEQLAEGYTEDAVMFPPSSPPAKGREAIAAVLGGLPAMGVTSVGLETLEVDVLGDVAIEVGKLRLLGEAETVLDEASYVVVWKRVGDRWLLHRDIWNSDLAPPAPAAE